MKNGNLRDGSVEIGEVRYDVTLLEEGGWSYGRLWTSDDNHMKITLAAEHLTLDDQAIEITGETHDDGSLTFLPR